jgi:hypothetical protein
MNIGTYIGQYELLIIMWTRLLRDLQGTESEGRELQPGELSERKRGYHVIHLFEPVHNLIPQLRSLLCKKDLFSFSLRHPQLLRHSRFQFCFHLTIYKFRTFPPRSSTQWTLQIQKQRPPCRITV